MNEKDFNTLIDKLYDNLKDDKKTEMQEEILNAKVNFSNTCQEHEKYKQTNEELQQTNEMLRNVNNKLYTQVGNINLNTVTNNNNSNNSNDISKLKGVAELFDSNGRMI